MRRAIDAIARLPWHIRALIAALLVAATCAVFGADLGTLLKPRAYQLSEVVEDFNSVSSAPGTTVQGFHHCIDGWCLAPGTSGQLLYRAELPPSARFVELLAWMYAPSQTRNRLSASVDGGGSFQTLGDNVRTTMQTFHVKLAGPDRRSILLRVDARNDSPNEVLVVDQFVVRALDGPPTPPFGRDRLFLGIAGLVLGVALLSRRPGWALATALVVLVGVWLRLGPFPVFASARLEPDAENYLAFARSFSFAGPAWFYSAQFSEREPLFICVAHYFLRIAGDSAFQLRLLTFVLSAAVIWMVGWFGRARFGRLGGLVMALLAATSGPLIAQAPRALRLETEILLWLPFLWLAFLAPRLEGWRKALLVGLAGGLASLVRTTYLPVVVALAVVAFFEHPKHGWRWLRHAALAATLAVLLVAPHRYAMYRVHGDAFWDTTKYARWNANVEFAGRPGFPTAAELQLNGYLGPPMTYKEYLFGLHTVPELVAGTVRGYGKLFWHMRSFPDRFQGWWPAELGNAALQLLCLIGFGLALLNPRDRWLPIAFLLVEWAPSFLYDRGLVETYRHTYQGYPLFLMAAVLAMSTMLARVRPSSNAAPPRSGDPRDSDSATNRPASEPVSTMTRI